MFFKFLSFLLLTVFFIDSGIAKPKKSKKTSVKVQKKETKSKKESKIPEVPKPREKLEICDAPYAFLVDGRTSKVLFDRESDTLMQPASMTKMMTAYIVMEHLKSGALKEDTLFSVSKNAFKLEGSTSFLSLDEQISVMQLLRGLIVHSGNDTAVVLAEGIAGTEKDFAEMMNRKAEELGMRSTHFVNASGLPHPDHQTTAHDLYILAKHLHRDFPQYYAMWSEKEFTFKGITQANRNPLLFKNMGCDGLKTGSSSVSGFGIVARCSQNGRAIYAVINGSTSSNKRSYDIAELVNYGLNAFSTYKLFNKGHVVDQVPIWYGNIKRVKIGFAGVVEFTEKKFNPAEIKIEFQYEKLLKAPLKKGDIVGKAIIRIPIQKELMEVPIVCLENVESTNLFGRIYDGFVHLFGGRSYETIYKNYKTLYNL
jgi:D-alanyl-D-alanine carboxypeptidase (penicillin-binding protein 5/6)